MNSSPGPGRNDPCPCGSGRKFKQCCALKPGPVMLPELAALSTRGQTRGASPSTSRRDYTEASRRLATAASLRRAGRCAESVPHLQRAAALLPARAEIHAELGSSLLACHRATEALASFEHAIRLDPKLALAHYHIGLALMELGQERAALDAFEQAAALDPKLAEVHRQRGSLLAQLGLRAQAGAAFRAAASAADRPAQASLDNAEALYQEGRDDEAEAALRRAKALEPANIVTAEMFGRIHAQQGRLAEAAEEYRSVLARDAGRPGAALALFTVARAQEADRPLLAELARQAARPELWPLARMMLEFALGRAYEQLRDYAEAIRHFDGGNAIRTAIAPLDPQLLKRDTERVVAAFPPGSLASKGDEADGAGERAILILGLPRSGTTLTEQILSSHPMVAPGGETGFWSERGPGVLEAGASEEMLAPIADRYRAFLDGIDPKAARVTDKDTFNFIWIGIIRRALPRARIIHVRRNPIDNAVSLYTTYFVNRRLFFVGNRENLALYCENYLRLMDHWRAVLPPERFMEIDYEALVRDRENETRRLVEFCGLPWDEACLYPEKNTRAIDTASLWQARQPVYTSSLERWRNYAPWLGALLRLAPSQEEPAL